MITPITYVRKPFAVEGVKVDEANMHLVADWCGGEVREADQKRYIKVPVKNPLNDRQTRAAIGDWVLGSIDGFKVYSEAAFARSFEKPTGEVLDRLLQERKPRPFPGEPVEMQEEVTPLSRQNNIVVEGGVPQIIDLRDVTQAVQYNRPVGQ